MNGFDVFLLKHRFLAAENFPISHVSQILDLPKCNRSYGLSLGAIRGNWNNWSSTPMEPLCRTRPADVIGVKTPITDDERVYKVTWIHLDGELQ